MADRTYCLSCGRWRQTSNMIFAVGRKAICADCTSRAKKQQLAEWQQKHAEATKRKAARLFGTPEARMATEAKIERLKREKD